MLPRVPAARAFPQIPKPPPGHTAGHVPPPTLQCRPVRARRLFSILLNAATAASLAVFIAAAVMWFRSGTTWEWVAYEGEGGREYTAMSRLGAAVFDVTDGWLPNDGPRFQGRSDPVLDPNQPPPNVWHWHGLGVSRRAYDIGYQATGWPGKATSTSVTLPYRVLCPLAAVLPIVRLARRLARRRFAPGLCPACGYDLRATPERCPECGTIPA